MNLFPDEDLSQTEKEYNQNHEDDNKQEEKNLEGIISFYKISILSGMFESPPNDEKCSTSEILYKFILSVIIIVFQIISIILPYNKKIFGIKDLIVYLIFKTIFIYKILAYNIIDVIHVPRNMRSLLDIKAKIIYWIVIVLEFLFLVGFLIFTLYNIKTPKINNLVYYENNSIWFKDNDVVFFRPENFCYIKSQLDNSFTTDDLAMMTTLPRLYVFEDDKCCIKPNKRGIFNSTMKYIFGKNYENDNITILCKKISHNPILVITSDKILANAKNSFSANENLTFLEKQFDEKNNNYFENFSKQKCLENNCTNETCIEKYDIYEECIKNKNQNLCEIEWDEFTQCYWDNTSENYNITGFERYQISINSDTIIQPSFITSTGKLMAGTHYIVGGSFEDNCGLGLLIESLARNYVPYLFDNIIPLYSFFHRFFRNIFLKFESLNKKIVFIEPIASADIKNLEQLYTQFNFSHEALFTIGHSTTGTIMKGASYFYDIEGITFEASKGGFVDHIDNNKSTHSTNKIINIYSKGSFLTGIDVDCKLNSELPPKYIFPNVFDTACLTSIVCSESQKYIPFCLQVLDSKEIFNENLQAYINYTKFKS